MKIKEEEWEIVKDNVELFPNFIIDLEKGTVYSKKRKIYNTNTSKNGYHSCKIYDIYGNKYMNCHEVIIAQGLKLPKHLFPTDEKGRKYIVDHITPVSNGGTDAFSNLHLIPKSDNARNTKSIVNMSVAQKKRFETEDGFWLGKKRPDIADKLKVANTGKKLSEETKKKISEANKVSMKGKAPSEATKRGFIEKCTKPVVQTKDGRYITEYDSASEAQRETGIFSSNISFSCYHSTRKAGGYKWYFKEDYEKMMEEQMEYE